MKEIEFWLDGKYFREKDEGRTIFQKCFEKNVDIPCFCYHENLSIAGNCRMCLVELNTSVKLVASCAMPILNGMQIDTKSTRVLKARESVIEFLLINHPLDCPICDQGGECDLQDVTKEYGSDRGRYYEYSKRAVIDKECGSLIRMIMTRCIHCTRCIRFFNEIAGTSSLGMINRGGSSEVSSYVFKNLMDELSGNVIDLCPVGALTSRPYSFIARPWELHHCESIDFLDSVCSNVRIEYLNNKLYRILPIYNKDINEDWITNRVRFFYDSNDIQRLSNPLLKTVNGNFNVISWLSVFHLFFLNLSKHVDNNSSVVAFTSMFLDLKSIDAMRYFFNNIGSEIYYADFIEVNSDFRENFFLNNLLVNLDNNLFFVFICLNTRLESPILNSRLRKLSLLNDNLKFYGFGINSSYLNLPVNLYGNSLFQLLNLLKSKSIFNKDVLFGSYSYAVFNNHIKRDKIIFFFGVSFFYGCNNLFDSFKGWINKNFDLNYAVVFPFSGYLSFFEENSGFNKFLFNKFNFFFLSEVDDLNFLNSFNGLNYFSVYKGLFYDNGASVSNLIIPSFSFFERTTYYLNIEGKLRRSLRMLTSDKDLISDKELFFLLRVFKDLYLRHNYSFFKNWERVMKYFDFLTLDFDMKLRFEPIQLYNYKYISKSNHHFFNDLTLSSTVLNYYKIDAYSRNSRILSSVAFDYLVKLNIFL